MSKKSEEPEVEVVGVFDFWVSPNIWTGPHAESMPIKHNKKAEDFLRFKREKAIFSNEPPTYQYTLGPSKM